MTQATDYQTRQQLRIDVQPIPQSNIAVRERVAEPALIEVFPPGSDSPVLMKRQGESDFSQVKGGELVRRRHTEPKSLPPVQHSKFVNEQSSGVDFKSEWRTKQPRSPSPRFNRGGGVIANNPAFNPVAQLQGYTLGGVIDELFNLPKENRLKRDPLFADELNQLTYDAARDATRVFEDNLNNVWDNLRDAWYDLPKVGLPELDLPNINLPDFELPRVDLPKLDLPEFQLPDLKTPNFELPSLDDLRDILPEFKLPDWLIEFPPINPQEIQRQQDIEDIRERERERERPEEPDTEIRVREIIDQLDQGCVLFLSFSRIRFRKFDKYESSYGELHPIYKRTNWEPFEIATDSIGNPADQNKFGQVVERGGDSATYSNPYYINTSHDPYYVPSSSDYRNSYKYEAFLWRESKENPLESTIEIQILKIVIPRTFKPGQQPDFSDLSYLLYNDLEKRYFYDPSDEAYKTNINQFALSHARSTCPIDLPPPDRPVIPPSPPEDEMQCSCRDIALIFKRTLLSMKYKIIIPIVSCELEDDRWIPKVAYKALEVFAVDAATAASQAEVYREMAIQAKELCYAKNVIEQVDKLSKVVGIDEYPASLPASLISQDEGFIGNLIPNPNVEIPNLTRLMSWYIERFDEVMGQFEIPIEVKDSDPTTPGDQPVGMKLPNVAESIAEMIGLLLQSTINTESLISLTTRTLIESGQDKQQNYLNYMLLQAVVDYLGFNYKENKVKLPMAFTPGKEKLEELLKETAIDIAVPEFDEKFNFQTDLIRLKEAAATIKSVYFEKVNPFGDVKKEIMDKLKEARDLAKKINKDGDKQFEKFISDAEVGFTNTTGITDSTNPYGYPYANRPKIRELGANNSTDTNSAT